MKVITCDLCKRILGKTVDFGHFQAITVAEYKPADFDAGFYTGISEGRSVDICNECSNKICEAQNKVVEEIKASNPQS